MASYTKSMCTMIQCVPCKNHNTKNVLLGAFKMKYIKIENLSNEQIMLIQNELTDIYQVVVEGYQNYSFTPDYVSKGYKSLSSAKKHFEHIVNKYKQGI